MTVWSRSWSLVRVCACGVSPMLPPTAAAPPAARCRVRLLSTLSSLSSPSPSLPSCPGPSTRTASANLPQGRLCSSLLFPVFFFSVGRLFFSFAKSGFQIFPAAATDLVVPSAASLCAEPIKDHLSARHPVCLLLSPLSRFVCRHGVELHHQHYRTSLALLPHVCVCVCVCVPAAFFAPPAARPTSRLLLLRRPESVPDCRWSGVDARKTRITHSAAFSFWTLDWLFYLPFCGRRF